MEFVYVVERSELFDLHYPQGPVLWNRQPREVESYLARIRQHGFFLERRKAEEDNRFKQIIPYVLVRRENALLLLERTKAQGERRLHGKLSIGIGGHVNPVDRAGSRERDVEATADDVLLEGLRREVEEELHVRGTPRIRASGFLNDDATAVGAVHFGFVAVADATACEVEIRETEMMAGRFVELDELRALHARESDRFETWSSLLLDELEAVLAAELPLERTAAHRGG